MPELLVTSPAAVGLGWGCALKGHGPDGTWQHSLHC